SPRLRGSGWRRCVSGSMIASSFPHRSAHDPTHPRAAMRSRITFLPAVLAALAAAPLAAQGSFGTAGSTPFQLRGQVYYLDEGADHLPDFSRLRPQGIISTTVLHVPLTSFEVGFPGATNR